MNELVPLEELERKKLPVDLSGENGTNRVIERVPQIVANNDLQALQCWLSEYVNSADTYRNYKKEAERMILWAIFERQKALSSLNADDLIAYSNFLENPQPREKWCCSKGQHRDGRWSENWRPFIGSLTPASKRTALNILQSLFNYLVSVEYLARNPFIPVRKQIKAEKKTADEIIQTRLAQRMPDIHQWQAMLEALELLPENTKDERLVKGRLRWFIALFYFTALRATEVSKHGMRHFLKAHDYRNAKDRWWLFITRKGGKVKKVPVNSELMKELEKYRILLGLPKEPNNQETEPLIRSLNSSRPVTSRRLNQMLDELTQKAALLIEEHYPEKAVHLRRMSIHWFRHFSLTMQDTLGINKLHIKENAGHENEQTTNQYIHAIDEERHEEMEKLKWKFSVFNDGTSKNNNIIRELI